VSSQYGREGEGGDLLRVEGDARGRWGRREVRARAEREAVRRAASPEPELAVLVRACATKLNIAAIRSKEYNINVRGGAGGGRSSRCAAAATAGFGFGRHTPRVELAALGEGEGMEVARRSHRDGPGADLGAARRGAIDQVPEPELPARVGAAREELAVDGDEQRVRAPTRDRDHREVQRPCVGAAQPSVGARGPRRRAPGAQLGPPGSCAPARWSPCCSGCPLPLQSCPELLSPVENTLHAVVHTTVWFAPHSSDAIGCRPSMSHVDTGSFCPAPGSARLPHCPNWLSPMTQSLPSSTSFASLSSNCPASCPWVESRELAETSARSGAPSVRWGSAARPNELPSEIARPTPEFAWETASSDCSELAPDGRGSARESLASALSLLTCFVSSTLSVGLEKDPPGFSAGSSGCFCRGAAWANRATGIACRPRTPPPTALRPLFVVQLTNCFFLTSRGMYTESKVKFALL